MADDADLLISAGFSDAKLAAEVNKVVGKFAEAGKKAQDAFNKTAEGAVANSQVVKANAREIERLKRAYDPLYAASKRYEGELEKLNRAHKIGAISAKQHEAALERLNAELAGTEKVSTRTIGSFRSQGNALQQIGFQVGDFATQVGAGTSAAQALGQQLPQLLGAFGTFGALAGAGAAIFIPLAAWLFRMSGDAETAEESLKGLTEATDSYSAAADLARTPIADLREEFGDLADEIQRVGGIQASFLKQLAERNLTATAGLLSSEFGGLSTVGDFRSNTQAEAEIEKTLRRLRKEFDGNEEAAAAFVDQLKKLDDAKGPDEVIKAVEELQTIIEDFALSGGDVSSNLEGFFSSLTSLAENAAKQVGASISEQEKAWSDLTEKYGQDTAKMNELADDRKAAESALTQAVKDGNAEKIKAAEEYIRVIDREISKVREAAAANDAILQSRIRAYQSYGASRMQSAAINGGAVDVIKQFESFRSTPYYDVNAFRAGFGSDTVTLADGSVQKVVQGMTVSLADANRDLIRRVNEFQQGIIADIGGERFDSFTTEQQAALTSIAYNYGSLPDRIIEAVRSGTADDIANAVAGLAGDNNGINAARRRTEASAFGSGAAGFAEFDAQQEAQRTADKEAADTLKEQVKERERQLNLAKQLSEQLSSNLLTEQQTAELESQRAARIAEINAGNLSDGDKAAAIAAVNAELEKQATIYKLAEEAKRRGLDLDAQMVGSAMTYRQAIESLGEAQKQQIINQQQVNAEQEKAAEQTEYAIQQQRVFEEGFVSAIMSTENFGDALKKLAVQLLATAAQAQLMAALFGSGPMGNGAGILSGLSSLIGGAFGGFSAGGYTGSGGRYEPAGIVHRGEYVMSAQAVQRIGLPNLEALHNGRIAPSSGGGGMSYNPSINIAGDASEKTVAMIERALDRERSQFFGRWTAAQKQFGSRMA